ncbi:MAG: helix-turn-helix domain-containing protein [Clostridia bacterium]|nr:helix-turn-helix domain-containing protein [Clostridia bacterium]MDE7400607.1 helix-turn-helix domain-containing protein [Clostridia bacterium]
MRTKGKKTEPDMLKQINVAAGGSLLDGLISEALKNRLPVLPSAPDTGVYARAFEDKDLVSTCLCLFENDLNVSRTAGKLYMHRNTLIYRIAKLKKLTGLDVCKFSDAVTFIILYRCYMKEAGLK